MDSAFFSEPVVQFNTWVSCDSSRPPLPARRSPKLAGEHVYLEDVQTDEDKLNSSLLSSESTFLPFTSDFEPQALHSGSEDETETFEPDSLAPTHPSKTKGQSRTKTNNPTDQQERETLKEESVSVAATETGGLSGVTPQNESKMSSGLSKAKVKEASKQEPAGLCVSKLGLIEADKAAIKIQSCWRGHYTRNYHPAAREVRGELRLRRMQEHILFLSDKLDTYVTLSTFLSFLFKPISYDCTVTCALNTL